MFSQERVPSLGQRLNIHRDKALCIIKNLLKTGLWLITCSNRSGLDAGSFPKFYPTPEMGIQILFMEPKDEFHKYANTVAGGQGLF